MKSPYTVLEPLWHEGILRLKGEVIDLTGAAAKYLGHAVHEGAIEAEKRIVQAVKRRAKAPEIDGGDA